MIVFETILEQDGPPPPPFDSYFCETRGNLVSNTVMPPFIKKILPLENLFRVFRVFGGSLYKFRYIKKECFRHSA